MSTESTQQVLDGSGTPSGYDTFSSSGEGSEQKLDVGFRTMPRERVQEIARMGGRERGRQMHEAAKRGESGTAKKSP